MKHFLSAIFCAGALLASCTSAESQASAAAEADTVVTDTTVVTKPLPQQVTIAMVGDIMMGNTWPKDRLPQADGAHLFDDVSPVLKQANVAIGNLEGVIAPPEVGSPRKNTQSKLAFMFKMPPRYTRYLKEAGFDFLGLSNNHIYDFFSAPITTTEQALTEAGIGFAGAKDPSKKEHTFTSFKTIDGVTYGFASFGTEHYNASLHDEALVKSTIKQLRAKADVVVIYFHGGAEGTVARHLPDAAEMFHGDNRGHLRHFTHLCIDEGADLVFGSGPHVVRAIELYKGHFIAYSLGNFCTCGMGIVAQTGLAPVITATIDPNGGKFVSGKIHAFRQQYMQGPKTDRSGEAIKEIRSLTEDDFKDSKLTIADDGAITIK
ncbi:MAG: CapA family protein [Bacteroidales bacterium]|nr:CapA family protein [Bacteroidales bacterium]